MAHTFDNPMLCFFPLWFNICCVFDFHLLACCTIKSIRSIKLLFVFYSQISSHENTANYLNTLQILFLYIKWVRYTCFCMHTMWGSNHILWHIIGLRVWDLAQTFLLYIAAAGAERTNSEPWTAPQFTAPLHCVFIIHMCNMDIVKDNEGEIHSCSCFFWW